MDVHSTLPLFLVCLAITGGVLGVHAAEFNVLDYKAVGDGIADDSQAFLDAWTATCAAKDSSSRMIVPAGKTFVVGFTRFKGPCKSPVVNLEVSGGIVAPEDPNSWRGDTSAWLKFMGINGLVVNGSGLIDGRGAKWWEQACSQNQGKPGCLTQSPTALKVYSSKDLVISDLKFVNAATVHIHVMDTERANIMNIDITSPEWSHQNDGIHINKAKHVNIQNCRIASGDDCISFGDHVYNVTVKDITCGPGHGISIGSLGSEGSTADVELIRVSNVNITGTSNGARIKTWQGGKGYVKNISFENFNLNNVEHPITIDQYYFCFKDGVCSEQKDAVEISNIQFANFHGTSASPVAIMLNCSRTVACKGIHLSDINLSATPDLKTGGVNAACVNVHGTTDGRVTPNVPCLRN